ncbi:MAG: hypothetical protein ACI8ZX_000109, partial [Planctomycetota bacterium]
LTKFLYSQEIYQTRVFYLITLKENKIKKELWQQYYL